MGKYQEAWDQVRLSPQADARIRNALADAQRTGGQVVPLRPGAPGKKAARKTARTVLIAAVIAGLFSVTALAVGVSRIIFHSETMLVVGPGESDYTEEVQFSFDTVGDGPIDMGVWTLDVPEGYGESGDSSYRDSYANAVWEDESGQRIALHYEAADLPFGQWAVDKDDIVQQLDVTVNGSAATLLTTDLGTQLIWTDDELGVGFTLSCSDGDLDLIALAETAHQVDEVPPLTEDTLAAIEQLGDWQPALSDAYIERGSYGYPGEAPYVVRTWVNGEGCSVNLRYEPHIPGFTYDNYYVGAYRDGEGKEPDDPYAGYTVSDITVQGQPAGLVESPDGSPLMVVWVAEDESVYFALSAEGMTTPELLDLAETVTFEG